MRALQSLGLAPGVDAPNKLLDYLTLLARWNRVYNLTAVREPGAMVTQHVLDCAAAVPPLLRHFAQRIDPAPAQPGATRELSPGAAGGSRRLLDVGSGAGLPGVVLAILAPQWEVTCVDTVAKKAGFIRQVAAELGLPNLRAVHARVEDLPAGPGYDVIASRAFSSLADFAALTAPLLAPAGVWLAMKGREPDDEIASLPPGVEVFHVEPLQVPGLDARRCLVWMRTKNA